MTTNSVRAFLGITLSLAVIMPATTRAQSSTANKNLSSNLTSARTALTTAQQSLTAAAANLKESDAHYRFQMRHASNVRAQVFEEHDKRSDLIDARKNAEKLDKDLHAITQPILDRVKARDDYRALAKKHDAAEKKIKDGPETENQRKNLIDEMFALHKQMREIEKEALLANAEARAAHATLQEARARLQEMCKERDQAVESDSKFTEAVTNLQSSKTALEQAKVNLVSQEANLVAAERHLAQATAAQNASRRRTSYRRRN